MNFVEKHKILDPFGIKLSVKLALQVGLRNALRPSESIAVYRTTLSVPCRQHKGLVIA